MCYTPRLIVEVNVQQDSKLVYGIGFNDKKYLAKIKGKHTDEYIAWQNMLMRCTKSCWDKHSTYIGAYCSDTFKSYSSFYDWYQTQPNANNRDEDGKKWCLDKDILVKGNKMYSETTCIFIPQRINALLTKSNATRGKHPIGVSWKKQSDRYSARCNTDRGVAKHLGYFDTPEEAFCVYKAYKEQLIKDVANNYKDLLDSHAYDALMNYSVDIDD